MTGIETLQKAGNGVVPMPRAAQLLGWEAIDLEPGFVRARFTARDDFLNPHGDVQGGFLAAMLDDVMGPACLTLFDDAVPAPTLEMHVNFIRPAQPRPIIGEGFVVHHSRRFIRAEGRLLTEDGELIATATATHALAAEERREFNQRIASPGYLD